MTTKDTHIDDPQDAAEQETAREEAPSSDKPPRKTKHIAFLIAYLIVMGSVVGVLFWQMDRYVQKPNWRNWNKVSKTIKKQWKKNDAIAFSPGWLSGYAMDKNRYKGKFTPRDIVHAKRPPADRKRVWVVHAFVKSQTLPPPAGYRDVSISRVGYVHVQLIEKNP